MIRVWQVSYFMFHVFRPALHEIFKEHNPKEYAKWGGNCCRQTAIFGACILTKLLPEFKWAVWDGVFDDIIDGKPCRYNHAWILGTNPDSHKRLLVDLARTQKENIFSYVPNNSYPKDNPEYREMSLISKEKLDWECLIKNEIEFYTNLPSQEVLNLLLDRMKKIEEELKNGRR